jgi:8-oxo-dGTP diphosphatase
LNRLAPGAMLAGAAAAPAAFAQEDPMSDELGHPIHVPHPQAPAAGRRVRVAAAVVWREGRLLLTQRPPGGPLGLQWELPGGKVEDGESPEHALVREIREELGVHATPLEVLEVETHDYPHGLEVEVVFVQCLLDSYEFTPSPAVHAARWTAPESIELGSVLAGDREFLRGLGAGSR